MYQAMSDKPVAIVQVTAISGVSVVARSPSDSDIAYTVPSAPPATSRAPSPGTSAIEICQLKPIGAKTYSSPRPIMPARLYWIAGPVAPSGGDGKPDRNHTTHT